MAFDTELQVVPDLAERWDVSDDGLIYTFHLRANARFHNGKPVTANDFKWSFDRAASPDTGGPLASTYLGDIVGVSEVLEGSTTDISGIRS